jgi:magnesium chelatase subunit D
MPFTAIYNHERVKAAILVAAVDPSVSLLVSGRRGTAKSILCRSVRDLMPFDAGTFCEVPLGVSDDALLGTIDLDASIQKGEPVWDPGILARSHRGVCYIDEINLLEDATLSLILATLSSSVVRCEREGLSVQAPCECLAMASYNVAEGELRPSVADRFSMIVSTDDDEATFSIPLNRIAATDVAMQWSDSSMRVLEEYENEQAELREHIGISRRLLPNVRIDESQIRRILSVCVACGVQGHRAELFAVQIARASAALQHSIDVDDQDVNVALSLAVLPRATREPTEDILNPPPSAQTQGTRQAERERNDQNDEEKDEMQEEEANAGEMEPQTIEADESKLNVKQMMDVYEKAMLSSFAEKKQSSGAASGKTKRTSTMSMQRGRYVKPIFPPGGNIKSGRIAIDATLRAAAPFQLARRKRMQQQQANKKKLVYITQDDIRLKKLSRRSSALTIFLVDASGSMALNRMSVAKAAILRLLQISYTKRDSVSLVEMSGDAAVVLLPPTRSTLLVSRRLAVMPCGGGTPLAHGLKTASRVALNAHKVRGGKSAGQIRLVVLTDGRPTRSLEWSENPSSRVDSNAPTRQELQEEILTLVLRLDDFLHFLRCRLVIDTDSAFVSDKFCLSLANRMHAAYYALPRLEESSFADFISTASYL